MKLETEFAAAELAIERLCPSPWIDEVLRDILTGLPIHGMHSAPPFLTVHHLVGDHFDTEIIGIERPEDWNENRRRFIRLAGERFAKQKRDPLVVSLLSECWAKTWPQGEKPKRPVDLRLEEVKREIVMLCALTIDGRAGCAFREIERDHEALISGLGEIESIACGSLQENGEPAAEAEILKPFFHAYLHARFGPRDA